MKEIYDFSSFKAFVNNIRESINAECAIRDGIGNACQKLADSIKVNEEVKPEKTQIITVQITNVNGRELTADEIKKKLGVDDVIVKSNKHFEFEN